MPQNKQIVLDNRPQGEASASNFKLVTSETPALQEGQVLVTTIEGLGQLKNRVVNEA